jgi:hypothetical protein
MNCGNWLLIVAQQVLRYNNRRSTFLTSYITSQKDFGGIFMSMINSYRSSISRKRDELSRLSGDRAKESLKKAALKQKIVLASNSMKNSSSQSSIRAKMAEISRAESYIAAIDKRIADFDRKMAQKGKELAAEEKKLRCEEDKLHKKQEQDDKKMQNENEKILQQINQAIAVKKKQQTSMQKDIDLLKAVPDKITVLFFATNPKGTSQLRLDEEARTIQEMIRKSEHRDSISFETRWAVRPLDILQAINEINPDVVHFSGHGADTGELVLENTDGSAKFVTKEAITQVIMASSDKIHLLFFNACFSYEQAQEVVNHVEAAIGMSDSIGDKSACAFAAQFYSSLGFGLSVRKSFEQAKGVMMIESPTEANIPMLFEKVGVDLDELFIVRPLANC